MTTAEWLACDDPAKVFVAAGTAGLSARLPRSLAAVNAKRTPMASAVGVRFAIVRFRSDHPLGGQGAGGTGFMVGLVSLVSVVVVEGVVIDESVESVKSVVPVGKVVSVVVGGTRMLGFSRLSRHWTDRRVRRFMGGPTELGWGEKNTVTECCNASSVAEVNSPSREKCPRIALFSAVLRRWREDRAPGSRLLTPDQAKPALHLTA